MKKSNKVINGLWIGDKLSALELLTIRSFLSQGHDFHLWLYKPLAHPLPLGVLLKDANEIIPEDQIFSYTHTNTIGQGKGSFAGFSDIFRYKLLYEKGGWWSDMDITCLQPLAFPEPYFFRNHDFLQVVGNLMKCPAGSVLMKNCYERAIQEVRPNNLNWLKPVIILNEEIQKQGLGLFIKPDISNPDRWELVDYYRHFMPKKISHYYVLHWMNEEWRSKGIDKNTCIKGSLLEREMQRHNISVRSEGLAYRWFKLCVLNSRRWIYPLIPYRYRRVLKVLASYFMNTPRPSSTKAPPNQSM